ncbi:hypothetical protein E2C01_026815 [Portunus trituberculatus]|uniref:Uncharacterized protein n=1 Tax=Portunus trituberculatus TaxID=210409 RepID=A0A5B7EM16_PORTR|nr:hypothetical protein [Portunus trituberculatus]
MKSKKHSQLPPSKKYYSPLPAKRNSLSTTIPEETLVMSSLQPNNIMMHGKLSQKATKAYLALEPDNLKIMASKSDVFLTPEVIPLPRGTSTPSSTLMVALGSGHVRPRPLVLCLTLVNHIHLGLQFAVVFVNGVSTLVFVIFRFQEAVGNLKLTQYWSYIFLTGYLVNMGLIIQARIWINCSSSLQLDFLFISSCTFSFRAFLSFENFFPMIANFIPSNGLFGSDAAALEAKYKLLLRHLEGTPLWFLHNVGAPRPLRQVAVTHITFARPASVHIP